MPVLESLRAVLDVLERPCVLVDVREVEEDLDDVLVLRIPVPLLRGGAFRLVADGDRVPEIEVDELDLRAAVGVDDPEHRIARGVAQPGAVRGQDRGLLRELLLPARVAADQEVLLALAAAALLELVLRAVHERVHVRLQLLPERIVVDELGEGDDRDPALAQVAEHALLDGCDFARELRRHCARG